MSDRLKDLVAGCIILGAFLSIRLFGMPLSIVVQFTMLFAVLFHAQILGKRLLPALHWLPATALGLIGFFSLQSLGQTAWFYAGSPLGAISDTWTMTGAMLFCALVPWLGKERDPITPERGAPWTMRRTLLALSIGVASLSAWSYVLLAASRVATSDSIRTPWPLLPSGILLAIALVWLAAILMSWLVSSTALSATFCGLALSATTLIVPLLYRIGFGFDGFLHIATEKLILASGTLTPKPFYYIGQYVFTTWISRVGEIPIERVDRWLIPVATAILIPFTLYISRKKEDPNTLLFGLFLLPLSAFIATTPQSFAYLLGLAALILARSADDGTVHPLAPLLLGTWSAIVHPLAGIPILILVCAVIVLRPFRNRALRVVSRATSILFAILSAISVPILFLLLSLTGKTQVTFNTTNLFTAQPWMGLLDHLLPLPINAFVVWPGWTSLIIHALPALLIAANIAAIVRAKRSDKWQPSIFLATSLLLFLTGAALKTVGDFAFLIDYERGNYANRLNLIALLCLIPSTLPVIARLTDNTRRSQPLLGAAFTTACLMLAAAVSYDALPRNDALITGHGWSVGQSDIEAVRAIERDSAGRIYTVLANQSVSAAAVSQLGFKRYNGDVFFYPIPTGGDLYDVFLRMTYGDPSRDTAQDAAQLGGSDVVYVVLNDYWWNAANLSESLSAITDNEWSFGEPDTGIGRSVKVYKFDFKTPSKRPTATSGS